MLPSAGHLAIAQCIVSKYTPRPVIPYHTIPYHTILSAGPTTASSCPAHCAPSPPGSSLVGRPPKMIHSSFAFCVWLFNSKVTPYSIFVLRAAPSVLPASAVSRGRITLQDALSCCQLPNGAALQYGPQVGLIVKLLPRVDPVRILASLVPAHQPTQIACQRLHGNIFSTFWCVYQGRVLG